MGEKKRATWAFVICMLILCGGFFYWYEQYLSSAYDVEGMKINGTQSILASLISYGPGFLIGLVGAIVWRFVCNAIYRDAHAQWEHETSKASTSPSFDVRLDDANRRLALALQGSPADRLFFSGLMVAAVIAVITLIGHNVIYA